MNTFLARSKLQYEGILADEAAFFPFVISVEDPETLGCENPGFLIF